MAKRQAAEREVGEQRLHVAQKRRARGRIAHVADRGVPGQGADHRLAAEMIADQPERAMAVEQPAIEADDARRFLAAVLQGMEPEHAMCRGVVVTMDAEHAALLAQLVGGEDAMPGHGVGPAAGASVGNPARGSRKRQHSAGGEVIGDQSGQQGRAILDVGQDQSVLDPLGLLLRGDQDDQAEVCGTHHDRAARRAERQTGHPINGSERAAGYVVRHHRRRNLERDQRTTNATESAAASASHSVSMVPLASSRA